MNLNNLTDQDISEMKNFYQEELHKTEKRLEHIKRIIGKITPEKKDTQVETPTVQEYSSEKPSKEVVAIEKPKIKRRKKRGPKPVWEELIAKRLKVIKKPLSYDELTEDIMTFGQVPNEERAITRQKIWSTVGRARRQNKTFGVHKLNDTEKYIGLKSWFNQTGELKQVYQNKVARTSNNEKRRVVLTPKKNSSWIDYVMDFLKRANKPMLVKNFTLIAMEENDIDPKLYNKTRLAIARSLSHLVKNEKTVFHHLEKGKKPGYYALSEWADKKGELLESYRKKLNNKN